VNSSETSKKTSEPAKQVIQVLEQLGESWKKITKKEQKINEVQKVLKILIQSGIIEERAVRNLPVQFNEKDEIAYIEGHNIQRYVVHKYNSMLMKISAWIHGQFVRNESFESHWLIDWNPPRAGITIEIQTIQEDRRASEKNPEVVCPSSIIHGIGQLGFRISNVFTRERAGAVDTAIRGVQSVVKKGTAEAFLQFEVLVSKDNK